MQLLHTAFPSAHETKRTCPACTYIAIVRCTVSSTKLETISSTKLCLICEIMFVDTHFVGVGIVWYRMFRNLWSYWGLFVSIYEGDSNENLKYFYLIIYWIQKVHNDFIFLRSLQCVQYKCSSVSEVHGCLYKKIFWLRAQPLVHRLLDLFVGPERLASHRLFERPKHMKITGGEVWRVWQMWETFEGQILDCCNSWTGSKGPSIVMLQQNTLLRRPRRLDLIAGRRWSFGRSAYVALVTVFPLAM